jgi:2,3-bisphosphoglycerate-dependent phosphoglycerate mutase
MLAVAISDPQALAQAMRAIERAYLIGVPGATEVWLVRHGDCYEGITQVDQDPPLSPTGREQARRLGERLKRLQVDRVYASPLRRAQETARAIRDDFEIDARLVEVATDLSGGRVEVTEDPAAVVERVRSAVDDAAARHPGGRVVMVGHGVAILNFVSDVLRIEFGQLRIFPYYTSVNVVRVLGDRRMVGSVGDVAHLETGESGTSRTG